MQHFPMSRVTCGPRAAGCSDVLYSKVGTSDVKLRVFSPTRKYTHI